MPDSLSSKPPSKLFTVSVKISADKGRETFIADARNEAAKGGYGMRWVKRAKTPKPNPVRSQALGFIPT